MGRPKTTRLEPEYGRLGIKYMPREKWAEIRKIAKEIRDNYERNK